MLVDFYNKIPDDARIWIYASEKSLTKNQERYILNHQLDVLKDVRV